MQREDLKFDEFETYLQEQVKSHRLYPSENIWQNIDREIHGERQWPLLTLVGFVALVSIIILSVYYQPNSTLFAYQPLKVKVDNTSSAFKFQKNKVSDSKSIVALTNISKPEIFSLNLGVIEPEENLNTQINNNNFLNSEPVYLNSVVLSTPIVPNNTFKIPNTELQYSIKNYISTLSNENQNATKAVDNFLTEQEDIIALVSQQTKANSSKLNFHFYGTPSISYRSLKDEKSESPDNLTSAPPNLLANYTPTDLNKIIRHTPSMGFEVGVGVSYNVNPRFRIRTGLQFNFREYNLGAYRAATEVATIALVTPTRVDSINSIAFYRTRNGYSPIELKNKYFEVSIPLAFEYDLTNRKKLNFGVAASIQPTYLFSRNSFLLSTDYKNYTTNPTLVRSWNINSSIEGFVSYKVGNFKWTFGPQLRYQTLPTYTKQYSIREHLIDYGFKIGVSKALH